MGTRTLAQVAPTAGQVALNAYIYGYGGHSLVTPHVALKQLWWTDDRINSKVTRPYVVSKLRGQEREFLDRPVGFGEGLTDDTYMDWILEKSKRLFLILAELGVPDQIFGCIDDAWDDEDLPVSMDDVENLELAYDTDEALNKKFYNMQFVYLLRELQRGHHIDYGPKEHIPMEYVNSLPPAVSLQSWDRVHFPGRSDTIFVRRKFALTDKESGQDCREAFLKDVGKARTLQHEHIATLWASYTSENSGFVLSDFVAEHTLRTYIDHRTPMQLLRVAPADRPRLICEWMHCLADAVAFLHRRGSAHTAIRPSNILIDHDNRICFAEVGSLRTFQRGKKVNLAEVYDYAAPEAQVSHEPTAIVGSPPISSMHAFTRIRKMSSSTSSSSTASSTSSSTRSNSICTTTTTTPAASPHCKPSRPARSNSLSSLTASFIPPFARPTSSHIRNFSRHISVSTTTNQTTVPSSPITVASAPTPTSRVFPRSTILSPNSLRDLPIASPQHSDIFSLACVFLDLLTFMLKGRTTDFVKFRSSRQYNPATRKSRLDGSFHACDPERLHEWMDILAEDVARRQGEEVVLCAVPGLLELARRMMAQNSLLRPSAQQVKDRIESLLQGAAGVEDLCCAGRLWDEEANGHKHPATREPNFRDSLLRQASVDGRIKVSADEHAGVGAGAEAPSVPRRRRDNSFSSEATTKIKPGVWRKVFWRAKTG